MVNFGILTAEICWRVWGTPANFNSFHILASYLQPLRLGEEKKERQKIDRKKPQDKK